MRTRFGTLVAIVIAALGIGCMSVGLVGCDGQAAARAAEADRQLGELEIQIEGLEQQLEEATAAGDQQTVVSVEQELATTKQVLAALRRIAQAGALGQNDADAIGRMISDAGLQAATSGIAGPYAGLVALGTSLLGGLIGAFGQKRAVAPALAAGTEASRRALAAEARAANLARVVIATEEFGLIKDDKALKDGAKKFAGAEAVKELGRTIREGVGIGAAIA